MSKPLLSVAVITYNHEKFIRQALDSVLMQQTDFPFEIVIGEDCSTDDTRGILISYKDQYPDKIRMVTSEFNVGPLPNVLRTYRACNGDYIAVLEGDDYWTDPLKLQKQVDFLEANPDFSICFHKVKLLEKGKLKKDKSTKVPDSVSTIKELARQNYIHTPSCIFRKNDQVIDKLKLYMGLKVGDYTLHLYNAKMGKIKYINKSMAVYRKHEGSNWSKQNSKYIVENFNALLSRLIQSGDFKEIEKPLKNQMLSYQWSYFMQNIEDDEALTYLNEIFREDPGFVLDRIKNLMGHNRGPFEKMMRKTHNYFFKRRNQI